MLNKNLRILGLALALVFVGGLMASCKTHETCPAYTQANVDQTNNY